MSLHTDRRPRSNGVSSPELLTRWIPRALEQLEDRLTPSVTLSNNPTWLDAGPYNISNGQVANVPGTPSNSSIIGAIQAIAPDLSDPTGGRFYAGGVNGGVWRTVNGLAPNPVWVPLTDSFPSLSISTITINPDNNQQILAGIGGSADGTYSIDPNTGNKVSLDSRNVSGTTFGTTRGDLIGALYSADGGTTWTVLSNRIGGQNVVGVAIRGTTPANSYMLVATDKGLYRSTNSGATFTQISGTGILPATGVFDLAADPGAPLSIISNATWSAGTATITTGAAHALSPSQSVVITGTTATGGIPTAFNGTFTVTSVTANTFTFSLASNPGTYVSGGTATANPNADPLARNRFYIAMKSVAGTTTGTGGAGIYRSDDGGVTWGNLPVTSPLMLIGARTTNVQISVFNSGIITNNIVYVAVENDNPTGAGSSGSEVNLTGNDYGWFNRRSLVSTICWSPNQGGTWTRMDVPRTVTSEQDAVVTNNAAGIITVSTGVRHHLRTGDQVVITGVLDNGDPAATPPIPPRLIGAINGVRYITVTSETSFTLNNTTYTGSYRHVNQDVNLPIIYPNGTWQQILGANAGERSEFFDLTADRTDSSIVYLGTDRAASAFYANPSVGYTTFTSSIWVGDRLADPTGSGNTATSSNQWSALVNEGTSNGSAPPADVRDLVVGVNGRLLAATGGGLYSIASPSSLPSTVASASWAAGVATITTAFPHTYAVGQSVTIVGIASAVIAPAGAPAGYNGTFVVTSTTANSFTYALAADPGQFIAFDSVAAGVATVQMQGPHGFNVGQSVTVIGVVPNGYNGTFTITSTPGATQTSAPDVISTATWAAGVATITTAALHGVQVGQTVTITGVSVPGYNGTFVVTGVLSATQFTYALVAYPGNSTGGTQTNGADAILSATNSGTTATITTTAPHNIFVGQTVNIAGVSIAAFNGSYVVTVIDVPTNRFSYTLVAAPAGPGTGGTATTAANPITTAVWSSGVATITTTNPTGLVVGDTATINGVNASGYNGTFVVTSILAGNRFTYSLATDPANATGGLETPVGTANPIIDAVWNANTVTITTSAANNVVVGERVVIAGILPNGYNGTFVVTGVISPTQFTYTLTVNPGFATRTRPTSFTHALNATLTPSNTTSEAQVFSAGVVTWNSINGNLGVTNISSVAYDLQNNRAFAGTIDTQAITENTVGGTTYSPVFSPANLRGSFFDQASVFRVIADNSLLGNNGLVDGLTKRYFVGTNFSNILRQTVSNTNTVTSNTFLQFASPLTPGGRNTGLSTADAQLINANETVRISMALNQNDPRRAIFGYNGVYEDADPSGSTPTGSIVNTVTPTGMTGTVESLLYGGKRGGINFNQIVYMTTSTGQLWVRGEFGPTFTLLNTGSTGPIFAVAGDPDDYRHIFVVQGTGSQSKILESKDFGATFVDITDNLIGPVTADGTAGPGKLTTEIRAVALFDTTPGSSIPGDLTLLAGGRGGVYRLQLSSVNTGGSWSEYGSALPNTVVNDLQLIGNQRLVAGTAGRGIWDIPDISTTVTQDTTLVVDGTAGNDIITISLDPNNSNVILVWDGTTESAFAKGTFSAIQVNGLGGADRVFIDSTINRTTHLPIAGGNVDFVNFRITVDGGGDAGDTLTVVGEGATTARQVTITSNTIGAGAGDTIFNGSGRVIYTGFDLGTIDVSTGSGSDTYVLTSLTPGQTILRGGAGSETYNYSMNPGIPSTLTIVETPGSGTDTLNATGTSGNDTFAVSPTQVTLGANTVSTSGLEAVSVSGVGGDDVFNLTTTGASATTAIRILGGLGTDSLSVAGVAGNESVGVDISSALGGGAFTGLLQPVSFSTLENVGFNGGGGVNAFAWRDRTNGNYGTPTTLETGVIYTPTDATSGNIRVGAGAFPTVFFTNVNSSLVLSGDPDGSGDRDVLTIQGFSTTGLRSGGPFNESTSADGSDTFTVNDQYVAMSNSALGALRTVSFGTYANGAPTFRMINVRGGNEAVAGDRFTATPSLLTNIVINGMNPTSGVNGDQLTILASGPTTRSRVNDPAVGPAQTRVVQSSNGATLGYLNIEQITVADVSPGGGGGGVGGGGGGVNTEGFYAVGSDVGAPARVQVYNRLSGTVRYDFDPFPGFLGGIRVAVGDVNGDGTQDIVVAAGPNGPPHVKVFSGADGGLIASFYAYGVGFTGGVDVAVADLNGDGYAEIITGSGPGAGPHIKVFDGFDFSQTASYYAFDATFLGGIRVAVGDTNGDGTPDLIVGAQAGAEPRVTVFDGKTNAVLQNFFAFDPSFTGGVYVACGDVNGDGFADVIIGAGTGDLPNVKVIDGRNGVELASFLANAGSVDVVGSVPFEGGVRVATVDFDGDGIDEILTAKGAGTFPILRFYKLGVGVVTQAGQLQVFGPNYASGVYVGG